MLANRAFPSYDNPKQTKLSANDALDLYFKNCSIYVDTQSLARFGAMLANNGIIPATGERILKPHTVQAVVTIMTTCGMYNGAGKFTKELGVPSKSGVSGGLMTVIPGVGAFASFSPKLNAEGNTVKGIAMIQKLSFIYSNLNLFHKDIHKRDCTRKPYQTVIATTMCACTAASDGDLEELQRLYVLGVSMDKGDYDNRTPLHLAAAGGHIEVIKFLLGVGVYHSPKDRWGATPMNDAKNKKLYDYLLSKGAEKGKEVKYNSLPVENVTEDDYRLLWAGFYDEVHLMISMHTSGWKVNAYDYDGRTALGIAASEGNLASVKYLVIHGANIFHKDARGNNALDDATRESRQSVIDFLIKYLENARL